MHNNKLMHSKKCQKFSFYIKKKAHVVIHSFFPLYVQVASPQIKYKNKRNKTMRISIYTYMEFLFLINYGALAVLRGHKSSVDPQSQQLAPSLTGVP